MRRLVDTEEAARMLGITSRAVRKWFAAGKVEGKFEPGKRAGRSGMKLFVWIEDDQRAVGSRQKADKKERDHTRVNRGEPGREIVTPLFNGVPIDTETRGSGDSEITLHGSTMLTKDQKNANFVKLTETLPSGHQFLVSPHQVPPSPDGGVPTLETELRHPGALSPSAINADATENALDSGPRIDVRGELRRNDKADRIANLRFALIQAFNEEIAKNHRPKVETIRNFLSLYNSGVLLSDIHKELGEISRATLYNWRSAAAPQDLTPQYGGAGQSKVTEHEKNIVLTLLLHQNRLKVSYGITLAKEYLTKKRIDSPSSPSTLRRFIDQFKKEHYDIWILRREGEKALKDKVTPYAERDWRLLEVGDGLVADGHRLNFQVINPNTGKPCRAALVLFWDWRSSYPLGWELMLEESTQCVASALRNAIVALGKIPKWVYLDNGKAFKAKVFTQDIDFEDSELPGMFARLNINYHFAQPYNAQSKPIERIFGILNEQLERLVPSYTGASINDKPAWTKRNEKYARSLHNPVIPTIPETNGLIFAWRDRYAERSSRGRDGLRPIDIYNDGKGPGVDPAELIYLMMDREIKQVHRNGVTWLGWHWFDEAMYGLKDKVVIRYSLSDLSQIYVFHKNEFLCAAKPIELVHPMASESENPKDMEAVKDVIRLQKKVKNTTRKLCDLLETKQASQIDWSRTRNSEISETIEKIEAEKKPKVVRFSPFADAPESDPEIVEHDDAEQDHLPQRRRFKYDFEKYEWLMVQKSISEDDQKWIDQYRATSSAFKDVIGGKQ